MGIIGNPAPMGLTARPSAKMCMLEMARHTLPTVLTTLALDPRPRKRHLPNPTSSWALLRLGRIGFCILASNARHGFPNGIQEE